MVENETVFQRDESVPPEVGQRRYFEPLAMYFYIGVAILVSYLLFYMMGYRILVVVMLIFVLDILKSARFVLTYSENPVARKASYFNAAQSVAWLLFLTINGLGYEALGYYPVLPHLESLTLVAPLLILSAEFGMKNIETMYVRDAKH